ASSYGIDTLRGMATVRFALGNSAVELTTPLPGGSETAGLERYLATRIEGPFAIVFGSNDLDAAAARLREAGVAVGALIDPPAPPPPPRGRAVPRAAPRGVPVSVPEGPATPPAGAVGDSIASGVDHVVLFSDDLDGALALWRDTFGIPERWRREFPDRG